MHVDVHIFWRMVSLCVRACVRACVCAHACVRACVRACACAIPHYPPPLLPPPLLLPPQELKETQNRLITSACESFASAQLNEHLPTLPTSPSVTSVSSSLTGISSISGDHMRSHDDHMRSHDSAHPLRRVATPMEVDRDADVRELLSKVSTKARVIALRSQAFKRRHRFKKLMRSRSIGHLAELRETEEEEIARVARTEKLIKFPSELHLSAAYVDLEERAGVIVGALNRLIKGGPRVQASEVEEEEVEIPLLRSPHILDDGEDEKNDGVFAESDLLCLSPGERGEGVMR